MTTELLTEMWKIEDISACDEGMTLANNFITSCIRALDSGSSSNFNARFESYTRHRSDCEKCNEI